MLVDIGFEVDVEVGNGFVDVVGVVTIGGTAIYVVLLVVVDVVVDVEISSVYCTSINPSRFQTFGYCFFPSRFDVFVVFPGEAVVKKRPGLLFLLLLVLVGAFFVVEVGFVGFVIILLGEVTEVLLRMCGFDVVFIGALFGVAVLRAVVFFRLTWKKHKILRARKKHKNLRGNLIYVIKPNRVTFNIPTNQTCQPTN